jgi:hypothetical protein
MINTLKQLNNGQNVEVVPFFGMIRDAELINPWLRQAGDSVVGLHRAQATLHRAVSYRNFRVSACAITLLDEDLTVSYIHGHNKTPKQDGSVSLHAEDNVLEQVTQLARNDISVISVVGDVQLDDVTGLKAPTLLPCYKNCLPKLENSPRVNPATLIVSSTVDLKTVQYYDVETLRRSYESRNPDLLPTVTFESPDGIDQAEWREKLIYPIGHRAMYLF